MYVLTAKETDFLQGQPKDHSLLRQVSGIDIYRTRVFRPREAVLSLRDRIWTKPTDPSCNATFAAGPPGPSQRKNHLQNMKDFITFSLSSPDPHIGWLPGAIFRGMGIIKKNKVDVVYATGSPWTSLLIGTALKLLTNKPVVLDFRDPWVSNPGFMVRSRFFRLLESFMERFVVKSADLIVANTKELEQNFAERYHLSPNQVCTITNGFEAYFDSRPSLEKKFSLTHAGSLYFSRNPKNLLQAVRQLITEKILNNDNFVIYFIGGIAIDDPELKPLLADPALQKVMHIIPRIPFHEVCEYQRQSDILFLIQPDFPLQVPRKIYENMAFKKPVFAITNQSGATAALVKQEGLGIVVENRAEDIADALRQMFLSWQKGEMTETYNQNHDAYSNRVLSEKMRNQLIRVTLKNNSAEKNILKE